MAINEKYKLPEETGTETADMGTGTASGYVNPYAGQLDDLYKSITERQPFQYDVNGDVMYQNLRDQYITGGQMAMMDTMGQAAQLTGGYGNSYAQGVGQQAYQGYLRGLNDQIPDLYSMALQNYIQQGDAMMQQYGMLQDMAADDYGKWIDQRNYDYQVSQDEADRAYRDQMDAREMATAMLEAGTMPSEEMLAAAGLTEEYVTALYPNLTETGSAGPPPKTQPTADEIYDAAAEYGALEPAIAEIKAAKESGLITSEEFEMLMTKAHQELPSINKAPAPVSYK